MKTIYKYQLAITDRQIIKMPAGAKILTAQMQFGVICLWAIVDPSNELENRAFFICGTGIEYTSIPSQYVATVQDNNGFVWHIFESTNDS